MDAPTDNRFRSLWLANAGSNLGDGLYQVAFPLIAVGLTREPVLIAGVTLALTAAWPIFGLHAGSIVDRVDRRHVLVGVSAVRTAVLLGITALLLTGSLTIWWLYLGAFVLGVGETLADTALTALVPAVVEAERLEWANGRIVAGQTIMNSFAGPPLAGVLLAFGASLVTGVAGALYAFAGLALALVSGRYTAATGPGDLGNKPGAATEGVSRRVTEGFRFLWRHSLLRRLTLFTASMNLWWAAFAAVFVIYAVAPGELGLDAFGFGVLLTAMAAGGLAGSLVVARVQRALGTRNALALDFVGTMLLVGVPALTTDAVLVGLAMAGAAAGSAVWVVLVSSIRQRETPDAILGRVYSASRMISWGILPVGATLGGIGAALFGVQATFGVGALATLIALLLFLRSVRPDELAPAQLAETT